MIGPINLDSFSEWPLVDAAGPVLKHFMHPGLTMGLLSVYLLTKDISSKSADLQFTETFESHNVYRDIQIFINARCSLQGNRANILSSPFSV